MRAFILVPIALILLSGCATPTPPANADVGKRAAAPAEPVADGRVPREDFATKPASGTDAAQETIRRLQANDPLLSVAAQSRFTSDTAYFAALTGTIILQKTSVQRSSASFASYKIGAIEIHALPDGRARVWAEFTNVGKDVRTPKVYCRFNDNDERIAPVWRTLPPTNPKQRRLISFESTDTNVSRVTVLVR
jgi:PBP1b-binding outer membrane lipoprotein LpoB